MMLISCLSMNNKPFGKEPFAWRHDPDYQQQKLEKLEHLHEKILQEELSQVKDKYGNIIKKQLDVTRQPSEDLVESKKQRFREIATEALSSQARERHPYEILSTFQRCGNSVIENNPNTRNTESGNAQRQSVAGGYGAYTKTPSMGEVANHRKSTENRNQNREVVRAPPATKSASIRKDPPLPNKRPEPRQVHNKKQIGKQ